MNVTRPRQWPCRASGAGTYGSAVSPIFWVLGAMEWEGPVRPGNCSIPTALTNSDGVYGKVLAMDWNRVEGNWKQLKGKIKEQWGNLTDDDLDKIAGKREQLEGKIQEHYGLDKDAARKHVDDWIKKQ